MSLFRIRKSFSPKILKARTFSSAVPIEDEYTASPHYPEILDLSFKKKLERKKQTKYDEIKECKTIEEKQIKLNMPRYYGFKTYMLSEDYIPYNNLGLIQHITKTHLIVNKDLPEYFNNIDVEDVANKLKSEIEEAILLEMEGHKKLHEIKNEEVSKADIENNISSAMSRQINRIIINKLSKTHPHLAESQVDFDPRIECCWFAGGMDPPENIKRLREGIEWTKQFKDDPTDRLMCYEGSANVAVRSSMPLPSIIPFSDAENPDLEVPYFKYDPRVVGTKTEHRRIVNTPGYWPGETSKFGVISYHKRGHILSRRYDDPSDNLEALHRQGILASFAWLNAQANFLGFTTFNDITYPLTTQTVVTNGKLWSFYAYQLNTTTMYGDQIKENPKRNICWATPELKLYESIEGSKIIGFNPEVLKMLVKFYANKTEKRLGLNMTPYLSSEAKCIADYQNDEKREWLEREYKFLTSNRQRYIEMDEVYSWEKIYKIDNNTRQMDKKLRFFELKQKPQDRTLDNRLGKYVPRALRPDLPRHKGRRAPEFWP